MYSPALVRISPSASVNGVAQRAMRRKRAGLAKRCMAVLLARGRAGGRGRVGAGVAAGRGAGQAGRGASRARAKPALASDEFGGGRPAALALARPYINFRFGFARCSSCVSLYDLFER